MAGFLDVSFDTSELKLAIDNWVTVTGKDLARELPNQTRLLLKAAISITPPMGGGATPAAARKIGEAAVDRDLVGPYGLFVGVRIKGRRKITVVFGRKLKRGIFVKTKLQPYGSDPRPIYESRKGKRYTPNWSLDSKSRGQAAAYYVDKAKLAVLRAEQKAKVGKLASGWVVGLHRLGGNTFNWIERQIARGTRGRIRIALESEHPEIECWAEVKGTMQWEMERRLKKALELRTAALNRAIPHIIEKAMKKTGMARH